MCVTPKIGEHHKCGLSAGCVCVYSYDLYYARSVGSGDEVELTMFSKISVPFWTAMFTWVYPMQDGSGSNHAMIERIFGAGVQVQLRPLHFESLQLALRSAFQARHAQFWLAKCTTARPV